MAPPKKPTGTASVAKPAGTARRLVPRTITTEYVESLRAYSDVLYRGGLTPKGASRPESIAVLIEIGRDIGLPATMAVAWVAIINGRPSIYGDAAMALIRSSGLLVAESVKEWYEGEGDELTACFSIQRVGTAGPRTVRFSVFEAKRAKLWGKPGPWTEYPERQLMWRAKGFACRDEFQDVLCGLIFAEEARDLPRVVVVTDEAEGATPIERTTPPTVSLTPGPLPTVEEQQLAVLQRVAESSADLAGVPIISDRPALITHAQTEELTRLRKLYLARRGIQGGTEEAQTAWANLVGGAAREPVKAIKHLTEAQAAALITAVTAAVEIVAEAAAEESVRVEITDTQLDEAARLRSLFLTSKQIEDGTDAATAAWSEFVFVNTTPNGVRRVSHLTAPQADAFLVRIGEQLDPFTYPRKPSAD